MPDAQKKTQILILGAGFGGTYCAMRLEKTLAKRDDCEVTLVDRDNFILFTPMLHEVAASDLDPSDIVNPIRQLLKRVTFYEALVESIDLDAKRVVISYGFPAEEPDAHVRPAGGGPGLQHEVLRRRDGRQRDRDEDAGGRASSSATG